MHVISLHIRQSITDIVTIANAIIPHSEPVEDDGPLHGGQEGGGGEGEAGGGPLTQGEGELQPEVGGHQKGRLSS